MEDHGMGHAKVYFSLFAAEAFSVLRLILVLSPLIMLHLHGGNAKSASPPCHLHRHTPHTHHVIIYV